ncbi:hypothetical protein GGF46_004717, partial [Coemansia sp. RSA 552]
MVPEIETEPRDPPPSATESVSPLKDEAASVPPIMEADEDFLRRQYELAQLDGQ